MNGKVDKGRWPPLHAWTESCAFHMEWEQYILFDYVHLNDSHMDWGI